MSAIASITRPIEMSRYFQKLGLVTKRDSSFAPKPSEKNQINDPAAAPNAKSQRSSPN